MNNSKDLLQEVITANRARQKRARELNVRAGEKIFPVLAQSEMEEWLKPLLSGAVSAATVPNIELLRLPELDQELADKVVHENPESVELLGKTTAVEYQEGREPRIVLRLEKLEDPLWRELPDDGIRLPGGRKIQVAIRTAYGCDDIAADSDISRLKEKMRGHLNRKQWDEWRERPGIAIPGDDDNTAVPEITMVQYGSCTVTGEPLMAFGTLAPKVHRYYSSDPQFEVQWYRLRADAEASFSKAVVKLEEIKAEARANRELAEAKAAAETVKAKISDITSRKGWYDIDYSLRSKLEDRRYGYLPSTVAELRQWIAETNALIAEVEAVSAEAERKKVEKEAAQARLQKLLEDEYAACPACGNPWQSERRSGSVCYCLEYDEAVAAGYVLKRSVVADGRVLVAVEYTEGKVIRLSVLDEAVPEFAEMKTEALWKPPSDEERQLIQQLRAVEQRLEQFNRELDSCRGDHSSRVCLKFEQDPERKNLFAFANVKELSVLDSRTNGYVQFTGGVRCVCDPQRTKWLEVLPASGETWVCSWGKTIGISKGQPVIVVNPQVRVDEEVQRSLLAEIEKIEAEIDRVRTGNAPASPDIAEERSGGENQEVSPDMLKALREKWSKK